MLANTHVSQMLFNIQTGAKVEDEQGKSEKKKNCFRSLRMSVVVIIKDSCRNLLSLTT